MRKNKVVLYSLLALLVCGLLSVAYETELTNGEVDFEKACGKGNYDWEAMMSHAGNRERFLLLKRQFDAVKPSLAGVCKELRIPKRMHQVWIGPKALPAYFWQYQKSWQENHPDWEYYLWTDKEVATLDFELKDLYLRSTNFGEKSDILRAELLDRFGGLYMDVDCECIRPFDELHTKYDFYAGLEPPHQGDYTSQAPHLVISDALIGSSPNHPIIKEWKQLIRARWDEIEKRYPDSPKRVLLRTFYPFGEATVRYLADEERINVVLPCTYFYPLTFSQVSKGRLKKMNIVKRAVRSVTSLFSAAEEPFVELQPETMSVHYWGNSWIKSNEERFREMYQQLLALQTELEGLRAEVGTLKQITYSDSIS